MLHLPIERQAQAIDQPIDHLAGVVLRDIGQLGIQCRSLGTFVPHLVLNGAQVEACFHQMSAVAVTQRVQGDGLVDAAAFGNHLERTLQAATVHDLGCLKAQCGCFTGRE